MMLLMPLLGVALAIPPKLLQMVQEEIEREITDLDAKIKAAICSGVGLRVR